MSVKNEYVTQILKFSRVSKGLSQRALSHKVGFPQSHLSKIENGEVDLKTSSLIEIARALDLELMLVPRQLVNTVKILTAQANTLGDEELAPPAYRLDKD